MPLRVAAAALVALALLLGVATAAGAQDEPESTPATPTTFPQADAGVTAFGGVVAAAGEPIEGVTITVTAADGTEIDSVETGEDGGWLVEVPAVGTYSIVLDEDSLPEGAEIAEGRSSSLEIGATNGRTRPVPFPLAGDVSGGGGGRTTADKLAQSVVNGVKFGLIIAMTAVGLSLIFGTTGLVNFAHGELVAFGAIVAWFLNTGGPELQLLGAAAVAVAIAVALGGGLELGLWRPLRRKRAGSFQLMVISIGLSLAARQLLLIWFGSSSLRYADYAIQPVKVFGPVEITPRDLTVMGLSVAALLAVAAFLQRTRAGKAMRAVSDNPDLAESSGVNVERIIVLVWAMGAGLAALGGIFQGTVTNVNPLMGFQLLLLMFAGVVLGGLGTAYGAMVGSLVVGLATEVSTVWLNPELKYAWALVVLIIVLLVRPQGLLGTRERVG